MNKFRVVLAACAGVALSMSVGASFASAAGGTISGTVKYDGTAPAPKPVEITKDKEVCGLHQHFQEDLIVGSDGGIANAVVIVKGAKGDMKPGDVTFDQKGCDYVPHVLAFEAGSTVKIVNSDGILHNIHTYSTVNPSFNMAQPKFKKVIEQKIEKPEVIKVTCDAHGWMHGWWVSTDTPYFAVTDDKGNYSIKDVPPGDYTVQVWQEKLGTEDAKASVKDGATATTDFSMKPKG
ncbi:carboxypeptidase regulatory-like domain-containing protein [Candidatus Binatus sp.]|uniref:carboxypeptidase regulatory-like domain-containing protein n=1 Tax=Candidatus Binatus sp. TaxID=2811406 RepID=UPI003C6490A4